METLAEMIERLRGGRSYARVSELSGGKPSTSRVHQLAKEALPGLPGQDVIEGLAEGLGVRPFALLTAAAVSIGWDVTRQDAPLLQRLEAFDLGRLDVEEVDAVVSVVRVLLRGGRQQ